ncbi:hypothetical protein [Acinetobacter sp. HY1485]|uniref:hypothetical protein n=1 Tax=Acinetobacter sp. HY1485 TaxID=2970918 RepID=UPI0022B9542A|nr:hypothetical protein [Acinetobacter sp. HY1485]
MMTLTQAHTALIERVSQFTGIDQERIQYTQISNDFMVPQTGLWCAVDILGSQSVISGLADQPLTRRISMLQITCYARPNTGLIALNTLVDDWLVYLEYYQVDALECLNADVLQGENTDFIVRYIQVPFRVN